MPTPGDGREAPTPGDGRRDLSGPWTRVGGEGSPMCHVHGGLGQGQLANENESLSAAVMPATNEAENGPGGVPFGTMNRANIWCVVPTVTTSPQAVGARDVPPVRSANSMSWHLRATFRPVFSR